MDIKKHLENITTPLPTPIVASATTPYILNGEFYEILSQKGEGVTVRCRKCPGENIYRGSVKSTGNFHMHIKRKHSELLPRVHEMKLKSFTERKIKMPQKRQQMYSNNRKIIKNGRYTKFTTKVQSSHHDSDPSYNYQTEPIDYRKKKCKNPTMSDNDMIITKINNFLPNSYPIITTEQCAQNKCLFSLQQPPLAHQNSFAYIKRENTSPQDNTKVGEVGTFNQKCQKSNQIIMDSNISTQDEPLQMIQTSVPLIAAHQVPGHDVLLRVENHLKEIEREMRLRNQIESNRFFLDLAKFKFLHPNFSLQN